MATTLHLLLWATIISGLGRDSHSLELGPDPAGRLQGWETVGGLTSFCLHTQGSVAVDLGP